jgi:hypothetical protein
MIKPWFLTEGKFATVLIIPSSWGSQLDGENYINTVPHQSPQILFFVITYLLEDEQELSLAMLICCKRIYNF